MVFLRFELESCREWVRGLKKKSLSVRQLVLAAMFAALLAISGQISIPMVPAPITWQTLVVMLSGLLLGARLGFISMMVFVALVAIGAPLLAGGNGGIGVLLGPTGGFVLSWPLASMLIGWSVQKIANHGEIRFWHLMLVNIFGGIIVVYLIGVPWLMAVTGLEYNLPNLTKACFIFIPGDLIKTVVGSILAMAVYRADPSLRPKGKQVKQENQQVVS